MRPSTGDGLTQNQGAGWHKVWSTIDIIPLILTPRNRRQQGKIGPCRLLHSIDLERFVNGNGLARFDIHVAAKISSQQRHVLLGGIVRSQRSVNLPRALRIERKQYGTRRPMVQPMDGEYLARQLPLEEGGQDEGPW